jgi:molybdopterin-guanine dinucleotide biosynthesis protein A
MGRDKALLRHDGATQLERTVSLLGRHLARVFVSTRADQADDTERRRFPQIVDCHSEIGPVAGILSALEAHPTVTWLVLACDLPNVDDATVAFLLDNRAESQPFTAFTSSHDGLPEPLCALYRPDALPIVRSSVDAGTICPRKILIRSDTKLLEQPNPAALDNVNTPDDLVRVGMKMNA